MKHTFVLLGIVASFAAPLLAHADPESFRTGDNVNQKKVSSHKTAAVATHARSSRQVTYITNKSVTGSHLPLVVCRYEGQYYSNAPIAVYGRPDLDRTGQLSVGGELVQRDPAITFGGGRR